MEPMARGAAIRTMAKNDGIDKSSRELAYVSLAAFADDGTLDMEEIDGLLHVALRDGKITDGEKEVLRGVFNRVLEQDVSGEVWDRIQQVRSEYGI